MIVVGIDPGTTNCAYGRIRIELGRKPEVLSCAKWEPPPGPLDARIRHLSRLFEDVIAGSDLVSIEGYTYQGPERSSSRNAMDLPRVIERFKTICIFRDLPVVELTQQKIKGALAIKGDKPKRAIRRYVDLLTEGRRAPNQHCCDAIVAAIVGERIYRSTTRLAANQTVEKEQPETLARPELRVSLTPTKKSRTRGR
jgi:Holliday junction resolvasome RuvABC endonuclease subunit